MSTNPASPESSPPATEKPVEKDNPWSSIGWGVFLIVIGVVLYFVFNNWEQEGGRMKMNAIVLLVYNFLGKWGVLGVFGGLGVLLTLVGINGVVNGKKEE